MNTQTVNKVEHFEEISNKVDKLEMTPKEFEYEANKIFVDIKNVSNFRVFMEVNASKDLSVEERQQQVEYAKSLIHDRTREYKISKVY